MFKVDHVVTGKVSQALMPVWQYKPFLELYLC